MTALQLTIGYIVMPRPREEQPYDMEYLGFGVQFRTLDATLKTQSFGKRWRTRIFWHGLTRAEKDQLLNTFADMVTSVKEVIFADGYTLNAQALIGSWTQGVWFQPGSDTPYFAASFQIEQV